MKEICDEEIKNAIHKLEVEGASIKKYITDIDFSSYVKRFVENGGYDFNMTPKHNLKMLLQAIAVKLSLKVH